MSRLDLFDINITITIIAKDHTPICIDLAFIHATTISPKSSSDVYEILFT